MKNKLCLFTPLLFVILLSESVVYSNNLTVDKIKKSFSAFEKTVTKAVELMPEKYFDFTPVESVRNFSNQIIHTIWANYLFGSLIMEKENPFKEAPMLSKTEVLTELEKSFEYANDSFAKLADDDLQKEVAFFKGKSDIFSIILKWMQHHQREHGKTIMYLRMKGIKPPPSRGW